MKLFFTALLLIISVNSQSQTKDEIILELEKVFNEKAKTAEDVSIYYNFGENILDIDSKNQGLIIPLNLVSLKYDRNEYHEKIHYLLIKCITENCYMESLEIDKIVEATYAFPDKSTVYQVIELIDKLRER